MQKQKERVGMRGEKKYTYKLQYIILDEIFRTQYRMPHPPLREDICQTYTTPLHCNISYNMIFTYIEK